MQLENYSRTIFNLRVDREIRVLERSEALNALGIAPAKTVKIVAFESNNTMTNTGTKAWDKETGLVWNKIPNTTKMTWFEANNHCRGGNWGGRKGYRLSTIEELQSLYDPTIPPPPKNDRYPLPIGHPFTLLYGEEGQTTVFLDFYYLHI